MDVCTFCEIERGDRGARVVSSTETTLAFLDHRPLFPGHVLVIPRRHIGTIDDLPTELTEPLFGEAKRVARAVRTGMEAEGTFMAVNNTVSQSVPHLHVHVVPRRRGDGLRGFFWPRVGYDSEAHADAVQQRLRDLLISA